MTVAACRRDRPKKRRARPLSQPMRSRTGEYNQLTGRLSVRNSVLLRRRLFQLLAGNGRCVSIDCESVEFMDGAALATIVEFVMECRRRGVNLRLLNPSKGVHDAFSLYSLERMLDEITELSDEEFEGVLIILEDEVYESIRIPGVPKPAAQPEPAPLRRVV